MESSPDTETEAAGDTTEEVSVLLIEDDEDDYLLTREYVADFGDSDGYQLNWCPTYDEGLQQLVEGDHDICLLDFRLGARDGIDLLRQAHQRDCNTPVIMLTGAGDRRVDRAAMNAGAADYLVKSELTAGLLERSLRYSLERHRFVQKQRRLASENERLYREAKRALELRDEMHRIVVHDLKNPLNTMGLALQLMERHVERGANAEAFTRQLETQRMCIDQMRRLIQDLLEAARIEDGNLSLDRGIHRPEQLVEAAVGQHQIQADDRSMELTTDVADDLPAVDVDRRRIEQVFANLIGNAIKFTPEGGSIEVSATTDGDDVRFSVHDTGPGIAEKELPKLFDRFWQADDESSRGAGLGLAICKGIVDAHGGRIWAESSEGDGSTFSFTAPAVNESTE